MKSVHIISTGTANIASVAAALRRLGAVPVIVSTAEAAVDVERLVLPGVGAFGPAAASLAATGLDQVVREHVTRGRPLLAICLGMQLLADGSEEAPDSTGLGLIGGVVKRFPHNVRVPQLGWNRVEWRDGNQADGYGYFANSYCLRRAPEGWSEATTTHGAPFVSALRREAQLACQFHPELSGAYGARLLNDWWSAC
jgi:glutamine amidotransferase